MHIFYLSQKKKKKINRSSNDHILTFFFNFSETIDWLIIYTEQTSFLALSKQIPIVIFPSFPPFVSRVSPRSSCVRPPSRKTCPSRSTASASTWPKRHTTRCWKFTEGWAARPPPATFRARTWSSEPTRWSPWTAKCTANPRPPRWHSRCWASKCD